MKFEPTSKEVSNNNDKIGDDAISLKHIDINEVPDTTKLSSAIVTLTPRKNIKTIIFVSAGMLDDVNTAAVDTAWNGAEIHGGTGSLGDISTAKGPTHTPCLPAGT